MRSFKGAVVSMFCLLPGLANAWHTDGVVNCDSNGNGQRDWPDDLPLENVLVIVENLDGTFTRSGLTGPDGKFLIYLPDFPDTYRLTLDPATLPADTVYVTPASGEYTFSTTAAVFKFTGAFLIRSSICGQGEDPDDACWLTGGGPKFDPTMGIDAAEHGPVHSFGGNVHPGCNPDSGEGGQWNHVAHTLKLHFQGIAIHTVACGNVPGIPEGSESPVTPVNFIDFEGTGSLKGIKGNKVDHGLVYFRAHCEDRNEPGSKGAKDGALIDRYFLHVFADPANMAGTTLLLIDVDGDPITVDPVTITGGNLQIHISSCDTPPL